MTVDERRKIVGSLLITVVLGAVAVTIMGAGAGAICAGLILVALVVAKNL